MLADKMTRVFSCKGWIVFKRLNSPMIKPFHISNRKFTNNSQLVRKLLYSKNLTHTRPITKCLYGENGHAYKIMSNSTAYTNSLSPAPSVIEDLKVDSVENLLEKQWISMSNSELLENFKPLSHYAYQNSEDCNILKYKGIFDILAEKCPEFSDKELFQFMDLLQLWSNSEIHSNNVWKALDKTCFDRLSQFTTEEILLISDYMYKMDVVPYSNFIYHAMKVLDPKKMTAANLVQLAFLMKVKGPVSGFRIKEFEYHVDKNADKFSVEEWSIICMSFFKYQMAIRSPTLLLKIMQKLQTDIDNISDISLSSILKALRYSADLNILQAFELLLKSLESQVEDRNLLTLTHMALAQSKLLMENKILLPKIVEKFSKEIQNARLKDIERLTLSLYTSNYSPENTPFYKIAAEELQSPHRKIEMHKFIKPYVYTIMYMLKVNYFPEEMVKTILAPEFVKRFSHNDLSTLDREYVDISYCLLIDHPEYDGPKLRKDQLQYLIKKFGVFQKSTSKKFHKVDHAAKLMIDVAHYFKSTVGSESSIHLDSPLPYTYRQYIFMCYDPDNRTFLPPAEALSQIPLGEIKYAPKDGKRWFAIVPASHNVLTRNSNRPTGTLAMQLRHLERIGYKTVLVNFAVWNNLFTRNKKIEYVTQILSDSQVQAS